MIESRDILNYSLALSVVVLTILFSWILVYIIKIFRQFEKMVHDVIRAIERFNDALDYAKDKLAALVALIPVIVKGGEKVRTFVKTLRNKERQKQK